MSNEDNGPRFEELIAWQKARAMVKVVSELVDRPPIATRYAFKDQLHRAAVLSSPALAARAYLIARYFWRLP